MTFPREFFRINLIFAQKVSDITLEPIESSLLQYTNLYIRFGLGRNFDSQNPAWQEYLAGYFSTGDPTEGTYNFYLEQLEKTSKEPSSSPFGCFSYSLIRGNRIRLHFHNIEAEGQSPLSQEMRGKRISELQRMFSFIKDNEQNPINVVGASWLYNREGYRTLFPLAFIETAQVSENSYPYLSLWGQFIDNSGGLKQSLVDQFLICLEEQPLIIDLANCFPYQVLHLETQIKDFYQFYKV